MNRSMSNRNFFVAAVAFLMISSFWACNRGDGFKETSTGLKYKFHVKSDTTVQVMTYDIVNVLMNYRTKDSTLFESGLNPISFQVIPIDPGDLQEGILMMRKGDSATFALSPEKFFISMMKYKELPEMIKGIEEIYFDIKVVGIHPEPPVMKAERQDAVDRKAGESELIKRYVLNNNINVEPTASGLYFIELQKGTGKKAEAGKKVKVHFTGMEIYGRIFDSSYERGRPVEFILGRGDRIPAWDEAVAMMSEGGKARLIVPSALGYGGELRNNIKPYTPLVFEIELVEVVN